MGCAPIYGKEKKRKKQTNSLTKGLSEQNFI